MGLLDDAIREHLELKRLRGVDPGDVARAEQDALGPVRDEDGSESDEHADGRPDASLTADESLFSEPKSASDPEASASSHGSQATVEINMEAELERGIDVEHEGNASDEERMAPVGYPAHTQADRDESAEWEMSSSRPDERGEVATPERDTESPRTRDGNRDEDVEDAMEETPDLAQDTPEQKRSWFRRRPRRDSDLDD
jgi:hypothetical protein